MTLLGTEFLRRFFLHVLPKGFVKFHNRRPGRHSVDLSSNPFNGMGSALGVGEEQLEMFEEEQDSGPYRVRNPSQVSTCPFVLVACRSQIVTTDATCDV